jgi:two-component system phosphate regulon sensor histidine kinase PhoR
MVTELFKDGRVTGIESIWRGKNGAHIPVEANAALLKDKKGIVSGGVVGVRDVREQKKLEKMKNDFLSNISHELRTPLTSIKGSIDNLLDGIAGNLTEGQREYLSIINGESNRLVRLIDDLLDMNKLEARSLKLLPAEVEYVSLVAQAVYSLKELAYEKGLSIAMEWPAAEIPLAADRDRIYQVLVNLINNAIKFTDRGEIQVIVEEARNGSITTRIRDTGVGIPRDEIEKIFDRFYQIQRPLAEKSRGAGLGLAISKSLIEMHGGSITVESQEGAGSEFTFTLPLQSAG